MIIIPAAALMSTRRLHLSVVRLGFAAAKLRFFRTINLKMELIVFSVGFTPRPFFSAGVYTACLQLLSSLRDSLILHLVLLHLPGAEGFEGLVAEQRDKRNGAFFDMLFQFLVDEVVGEVDGGSILFRVAVVDALDMRPIDGAQTHGARLAGGIDDAVRKVEGAQFAACLADGVHLGMGGGVVVAGDAVRAAGDNFSVLHDDGPEGTATIFHTFVGEADGLAHVFFICFCDSHGCLFLPGVETPG